MASTPLTSTVATLVDVTKRLDPNGSIAAVGELLNQTNPILQDMQWKEGNLATGERVTVRTGLPAVYWRLLNQGISPSKSTTAQVDEQCGMLEAWAEVDKDVAELNGNSAAFRLDEARPFIESMNQEMAQTLFYGNPFTNPEEFLGLSPRYNSSTAGNGDNVILAGGGSGGDDQMSVWVVVWGPNTVYGIYPKGSKAGLLHEDLGLVTVETTAGVGGSRMRAYQDHWQWKCGLVVKDWRYAVRIAEIDQSALAANSSAPDLAVQLIRAIHRIPSLSAGRPVIYMNRTAAQYMDLQARSVVTGSALASTFYTGTNYGADGGYPSYDGKPVQMFRGIPIRVCDALVTETAALVS